MSTKYELFATCKSLFFLLKTITLLKEVLEWCYIDSATNEGRGPVSLRDIEVLWETGEITSQTFVWRQGMTEWKKIMELPDLQKKIYGLFFMLIF